MATDMTLTEKRERLYKMQMSRADEGTLTTTDGDKAYFVWRWVEGSKHILLGFIGKAMKPNVYMSFGSQERLMAYLASWIDGINSHNATVAARRAERNGAHNLKVGDVLMSMWGYEQTNVEYYEVTACLSKTMVEVRRIASLCEPTGHYAGKSVPAIGQYIEEPLKRKVDALSNSVRIDNVRSASLHEPTTIMGGVKIYAPLNYSYGY